MSPLWIVAAIVLLVIVVWRLSSTGLDRDIARAIQREDISQLLHKILSKKAVAQPACFNYAVRRLWDGYRRPLAVSLVREMATRHNEAHITQYWLAQVQTVEPGLANEQLDADFLSEYFKPQIAASCGTAGG